MVTLANGHRVKVKANGTIDMTTTATERPTRMRLKDSRLVPELRNNLLSVRAFDRKKGATIVVNDHCYLYKDGTEIANSGLSEQASVISCLNCQEYSIRSPRWRRPTWPSCTVRTRRNSGTGGSITWD